MEDSGYKNEYQKRIIELNDDEAVLDCWNKKVTLKFRGELHEVDLRDGDLCDNWNGVTLKTGEVFDFNFGWEYIDKDNIDDAPEPWLTLYNTYMQDGELLTNHSDNYYSLEVFFTNGKQYAYYHENLERPTETSIIEPINEIQI